MAGLGQLLLAHCPQVLAELRGGRPAPPDAHHHDVCLHRREVDRAEGRVQLLDAWGRQGGRLRARCRLPQPCPISRLKEGPFALPLHSTRVTVGTAGTGTASSWHSSQTSLPGWRFSPAARGRCRCCCYPGQCRLVLGTVSPASSGGVRVGTCRGQDPAVPRRVEACTARQRAGVRLRVPIPPGVPRGPRIPSAKRRALSWSLRSVTSACSSPTRAAAASTPACRIPPPSSFRARQASATNSLRPASTAPAGAPRPCTATRRVTRAAPGGCPCPPQGYAQGCPSLQAGRSA